MQVVRLNVYDLAEQNWYLAWAGVGIYHSGVEYAGVEYAYGGHEYNASGIFATSPREAPGPVTFRESIEIGETSLSPAEVQRIVHEMGVAYKGNRYHLLQRNCNAFSNDLCIRLTDKCAPSWVNRLAGIACAVHCLLPAQWVPPLAPPTMLPQAAEESQTLLAARQAEDALARGAS